MPIPRLLTRLNSCRIYFAFAAGNLQKGTKTVIFADSGRIEKQIVLTYRGTSKTPDIPKEIIGNRTVYHFASNTNIDSVLSIDLDLMTGIKRVRFVLGASVPLDNQMRKIREDTFLNKKCEVIDFNGAILWYWKGIILKKELGIDGVYEYATSIDENYIIKETEFEFPKNINLQ